MGYLTERAKEEIRRHVAEAGGNEVFFVGAVDDDGAVDDVRVIARGNEWAVPAVFEAASCGEVVIHNHPGGALTPSEADIELASVFGNRGVGFFIVSNDASRLYVVVEPTLAERVEMLDADELARVLEPGGAVHSVLGEAYERRDEQLEMMRAVVEAFNEDRISVIEAGTGTGKSLAYLLPAIYWARTNRERVVISTNTINLQEQLVHKDIPLLRKALPELGFEFSLVKGMANYVCLLRAEAARDAGAELFDDDEMDALADILDWSANTDDGSLSDLPYVPPESIWDRVNAESDSCLRARCPHYSGCFFFKARRRMAAADIIVANHHMVFSDLAIKGVADESAYGVLPPYTRIVFDEAHHVEEAATDHFGTSGTKHGLLRVLRRLLRKTRGGGGPKGLLPYVLAVAPTLERFMRKGMVDALVETVGERFAPAVEGAAKVVEESFDALYSFGVDGADGPQRDEGRGGEFRLRVTPALRRRRGWARLEEVFRRLRSSVRELAEHAASAAEILQPYEGEDEVVKIAVEFRSSWNKLNHYADLIHGFFSPDGDGYVRWMEGRLGRGGVVLGSLGLSPLDITREMNERLYGSARTVVFTSATLAVGGGFTFVKKELGLEGLGDRVDEHLVSSPFDYTRQVLLAVPVDMPLPTEDGYADALGRMVLDAALAAGGGALVLFTSYRVLDDCYGRVARELEASGIEVLRQGTEPRSRLMERFKLSGDAVLMATDSFWEGIDVPGEGLRLVVITRLPFKVPTEPVLEARVEEMERRGLNPFIEYTVPKAVIKFKQGFGRLIRSRDDRGAVLVLDTRIVSKNYGRYFLDSLPRCTVRIDDSRTVLEELHGFFASGPVPSEGD